MKEGRGGGQTDPTPPPPKKQKKLPSKSQAFLGLMRNFFWSILYVLLQTKVDITQVLRYLLTLNS